MPAKKYEGSKAERKIIATKNWRKNNPAKHLYTHRKYQALRRDIEFSLTFEQFLEMLKPMRCSVTALPLSFDGGKPSPWLPSIDRIDPHEGYTLQNCRVVCWIFNRAKHTGSDEDVIRMAEALAKRPL